MAVSNVSQMIFTGTFSCSPSETYIKAGVNFMVKHIIQMSSKKTSSSKKSFMFLATASSVVHVLQEILFI